MGFIALQSWSRGVSSSVHFLRPVGPNPKLYDVPQVQAVKPGLKFDVRSSSSRKSLKKLRRESRQSKELPKINVIKEEEEVAQVSSTEAQVNDISTSKDTIDVVVASRDKVLQACAVTSGFMAALGLIIRKVSHVASTEGLPVPDCSTDISFGFETWHLGLIAGIVVLISSSRLLLLNSWPDFADSSEAANRQILTSLEPQDYLFVSILPGISEVSKIQTQKFFPQFIGLISVEIMFPQEMLFRGGLMPLFGTNWTGIVAVGLIFGFLHLGSGRKYSFAVW